MKDSCYQNYTAVMEACKQTSKFTISVAAAEDTEVLMAVKMAEEMGLANSILVGDAAKITELAKKIHLRHYEIIHAAQDQQAAQQAVEQVKIGRADVLMKGLVNSSDFMRAVLNSANGLKTDRLLSHLAVFEIPGQPKLAFMTDGGLNINPNLVEKKQILCNALTALGAIGIVNPNVALLAANEQVSNKMQSTVDATALVEMRESGEIPTGILEGPIALDVAVSAEAAKHKGIKSKVSGDIDLYMVPNIEAGNLFGKALIYFANAKMAGVVLGAACPIVLTSRSETAEGKLNSLAVACLISQNSQIKSDQLLRSCNL